MDSIVVLLCQSGFVYTSHMTRFSNWANAMTMGVLPALDHLPAGAIIRMVVGLLCFCVMCTCVLWALAISLDRVNHVNERLPAGKQIGYPLGFLGPERHWRFEKEYEKLFPDRTLRRKERRLWLLGAVALIGLAIAIGPLL